MLSCEIYTNANSLTENQAVYLVIDLIMHSNNSGFFLGLEIIATFVSIHGLCWETGSEF